MTRFNIIWPIAFLLALSSCESKESKRSSTASELNNFAASLSETITVAPGSTHAIQDIIDNQPEISTIRLQAGVYRGTLDIHRNISIIGANGASVITNAHPALEAKQVPIVHDTPGVAADFFTEQQVKHLFYVDLPADFTFAERKEDQWAILYREIDGSDSVEAFGNYDALYNYESLYNLAYRKIPCKNGSEFWMIKCGSERAIALRGNADSKQGVLGFEQGFAYAESDKYLAQNGNSRKRIYFRVAKLPRDPNRKLYLYIPQSQANTSAPARPLIEVKGPSGAATSGVRLENLRFFLSAGRGVELTNKSNGTVIKNSFFHGMRDASLFIHNNSRANYIAYNGFYGDGVYSLHRSWAGQGGENLINGAGEVNFQGISWAALYQSNLGYNRGSEVVIRSYSNRFNNNYIYDGFDGLFHGAVAMQSNGETVMNLDTIAKFPNKLRYNMVVDIVDNPMEIETRSQVASGEITKNIFIGGQSPLSMAPVNNGSFAIEQNIFLQSGFYNDTLDVNKSVAIKIVNNGVDLRGVRLKNNSFFLPNYRLLGYNTERVDASSVHLDNNFFLTQKSILRNESNPERKNFSNYRQVLNERLATSNFTSINLFDGDFIKPSDNPQILTADSGLSFSIPTRQLRLSNAYPFKYVGADSYGSYSWSYPIVAGIVNGPAVQNLKSIIRETRRSVRSFHLDNPFYFTPADGIAGDRTYH